jgi:fumarate reductase (CoM/CoB) subunit A
LINHLQCLERWNPMEIIKTDVLIIGGGGAGMRAALAAKEKGAEVLIVSKTPIGKSTCTYLSAGAFALAMEGFSKETHFKLTVQDGKGINDLELVKTLVEEAPARIHELEKLGLRGEWRKGLFSCLGKAPSWGAPLTDLLSDAVREREISEKPWIAIFDLLMEEGKVIGALGFEFRKGVPVALLSRATLLANGGGGAIYPRNDNPVRTTGDGYALGFQAGCRLRDMEFIQFIPLTLAEPGSPAFLLAPPLADAGKVVNLSGEDILAKYQIVDKPVAARCRDSFSQAILKEEEGGEKVFLDLRSLGEKNWPKNNMALSQLAMLRDRFSCFQKPLRISPSVHFFSGGISADPDGKTEIPGLYAAGEVMGGLHGANRMGGNALSEIIVFGYRAGVACAEWALAVKKPGESKALIQSRWEAFQKKWKSNGKGFTPKGLRKRLGEILWNQGGVLREEKGLQAGLKEICRLKSEDLPWASSETPKEMLEKIEVDHALWVAEMILRSALLRQESRGAHFRKDYPFTDDRKWKGNVFLKKSREEMSLSFSPLPGIVS